MMIYFMVMVFVSRLLATNFTALMENSVIHTSSSHYLLAWVLKET